MSETLKVPAILVDPGDVLTVEFEGLDDHEWVVTDTAERSDVLPKTLIGLRSSTHPGIRRTIVVGSDEEMEVDRG